MTLEGVELFIIIIIWIIMMGVGIYVRICQQQKRKERAHITSQTRPLIIYHVPASFVRETAPPSFNPIIDIR